MDSRPLRSGRRVGLDYSHPFHAERDFLRRGGRSLPESAGAIECLRFRLAFGAAPAAREPRVEREEPCHPETGESLRLISPRRPQRAL